MRLWLAAYPMHLKGQVDVQTIVAAPDKAAILQVLIDQYVLAMGYKRPSEWFRQLWGIVSLGHPSGPEIDPTEGTPASRVGDARWARGDAPGGTSKDETGTAVAPVGKARTIRRFMFRHVPNALTAGRLVLAAVFFVLLALYQHGGRGDPWLLNTAFSVYVVALFTDFLDGYLARRWKVEGAFGRVVDPLVDKVLVLGSFIFFAGKNFIIPDTVQHLDRIRGIGVVKTVSGVAPGIVVILLTRELLVTSLRGTSETGGQAFGAAFSGKLKMVFQSVTILVILVYVNYLDLRNEADPFKVYGAYFRDFCIWATVAVTVISGLLYIQRAVILYRASRLQP